MRLVWHYLPFAPEYSESLQVLSARRRMQVELHAPSHGDRRSTLSLREKKSGVVQETSTTATKGSAEAMWEAFHAFVDKGTAPLSGAAESLAQVELLREVLETIVVADGRSLEAEATDPADPADDPADPADDAAPVVEAGSAQEAAVADGGDPVAPGDGDPRMVVSAPAHVVDPEQEEDPASTVEPGSAAEPAPDALVDPEPGRTPWSTPGPHRRRTAPPGAERPGLARGAACRPGIPTTRPPQLRLWGSPRSGLTGLARPIASDTPTLRHGCAHPCAASDTPPSERTR